MTVVRDADLVNGRIAAATVNGCNVSEPVRDIDFGGEWERYLVENNESLT